MIQLKMPDIVALMETKLEVDIFNETVFPRCYSLWRQDRKIREGGGVAMLVKENT